MPTGNFNDRMPSLPGYEELRMIGVGDGAFHVNLFLACATGTDNLVCVQHYLGSWPEIREHLSVRLGEYADLIDVNHPNIMRVFEMGETEDGGYVILEHLQEGTLADRLHEGPLPVRDALAIARTITQALQHARGKGLTQFDLGPSRIACDRSGNLKLSDFKRLAEIAAWTEDDFRRDLPADGWLLSPEDIMELISVAESADVYRVGALLYTLLSSNPPFSMLSADSEGGARIMAEILVQPPVPPTRTDTALPESVMRLCMWCLAKRPADRPASLRELLDNLVIA